MSDSSLSNGAPSHAALEEALRRAVRQVYSKGNLEDLTVKRIRKAAENDLDLTDDYFKEHSTWNAQSKSIIQSEVEAHADANSEPQSSQQPPKLESPKKPHKSEKSKPKIKTNKRASAGDARLEKRRKKDTLHNDGSASEDAGHMKEAPVSKAQKGGSISSTSLSQADSEDVKHVLHASSGGSLQKGAQTMDSESEMSVLLDEGPKPKKNRRSTESERPRAKKTGSSKGTKRTEKLEDPNAEEIKRLQGWLVKCGIRKLWHKELAKYDTPKAKINHLKAMLADAGMTGRFSIEKASQIREERELKADLEAVQAGAKQWGKAESDKEETGNPKKRLARGLKELDFLNDDDGAETD